MESRNNLMSLWHAAKIQRDEQLRLMFTHYGITFNPNGTEVQGCHIKTDYSDSQLRNDRTILAKLIQDCNDKYVALTRVHNMPSGTNSFPSYVTTSSKSSVAGTSYGASYGASTVPSTGTSYGTSYRLSTGTSYGTSYGPSTGPLYSSSVAQMPRPSSATPYSRGTSPRNMPNTEGEIFVNDRTGEQKAFYAPDLPLRGSVWAPLFVDAKVRNQRP